MNHPALDVSGVDSDLILAAADEYQPTAAQEDGDRLTLFFSSAMDRDRARDALVLAWPDIRVAAREVDDEDWARRSQEHLPPVRVGRVAVRSPGAATAETTADIGLVIQPSTGFGTGHHATTRLCLAGLQTLDLSGRFVVDVGTGSGILAIAARMLGAREAVGIDDDPDAVRAACENLPLNTGLNGVRFEVGDLAALGVQGGPAATALPAADVVTANLTAWHLTNHATTLLRLVRNGGALVASGMLVTERDLVASAFTRNLIEPPVGIAWEAEEDGWVGMVLRRD